MDTFTRDGLRFDVTDRGPADAETVVLLHGFPETGACWDGVAERLAERGLRTLTPDQRGYSPGAQPTGRRAYRVPELVADVAALIEAAGTGRVHVVGHDWGATVAWMLAAHRPELVTSVTGVSVPHPGAYERSLFTSRQGLLSWYMGVLQIPVLPDRLLGRRGVLEATLRRTGQVPEAATRDAAALAGRLTGPINWYRGLPLSSLRFQQAPVERPALLVWGDGDTFVSRAAIDLNAKFMRGEFRLEVLPGVNHWIPDRAPDDVARLVADQVRRTSR